MKRDALQLVRSIYRANKKKDHLENFLDEFELLKLEIRLCVDMKVVSFKTQAELTRPLAVTERLGILMSYLLV